MQRTWTVSQLRKPPTRDDIAERLRNVRAELRDLEAAAVPPHPRTLRAATALRDRLKGQLRQIDEHAAERQRQDEEDGLDPIKLANRIPR